MKLDIDLIRKVTCGIASAEYKDGKFYFYRFNAEEMSYYSQTQFAAKSNATAGVEMQFETDATALCLSGTVSAASSRTYYSIDVLKNGEFIGDIKNFNMDEMIPDYVQNKYKAGDFSARFELDGGIKSVRVVLPWSHAAYLYEVRLVGATFVKPIKKTKSMLIYGDSITQGYDAESSYLSYASRLSDSLDANALNKGIGGEIFVPALSAIKNDIKPDYITVAYGTNDWFHSTGREDFIKRAESFYKNLSKNYPESKIFAISPIWRQGTEGKVSNVGDFFEIRKIIKKIADSLENVIFIDGFDLVPHNTEYFADLRLHPRNIGFEFYAENLVRKIKEYI